MDDKVQEDVQEEKLLVYSNNKNSNIINTQLIII